MKRVIKLVNLLLLTLCCIISLFIYTNKQVSLLNLNNIYSFLNNHIKLDYNSKSVSSSLNYIYVSKYTYTNNSFSIYSPFSGTIISKNEYSILIRCDNDYHLIFKDIININVNNYDVINSEIKLANFIETYTMYFIKNGEIISYEDII